MTMGVPAGPEPLASCAPLLSSSVTFHVVAVRPFLAGVSVTVARGVAPLAIIGVN